MELRARESEGRREVPCPARNGCGGWAAPPAARQRSHLPAAPSAPSLLLPAGTGTRAALWWLRHPLGVAVAAVSGQWFLHRRPTFPKMPSPLGSCALRTPRGCRFGKHPGFRGHGRLWWWHPPRCTWTLRSAGTHGTRPVGNGGCCILHAARVQSASCSLPSTDPAGQSWGPWEERNPREFAFMSVIVNNGGKQLISNLFRCVLLKSFVTCVSVLVFPPPCTQLNAGDQRRSGGRVFGCAGGGLWGTIPAASATGATQLGMWDSPRAARQGPRTSAVGAVLSCKSVDYFKCL